MSEIADFLRARYAERRAIALAAAQTAGSADWRFEHNSDRVSAVQILDPGPNQREFWIPLLTEAASYVGDTLEDEIGSHVTANDPAAVLADLAAKLAVVDLCATLLHDDEGGTDPCAEGTLRHLAQPFAGHPDHKGEEWAP